ncbi:unnamed protein product, partial [Thlaspi arvense]
AVVDENKAIELDPSLAKGYLRKGIRRERFGSSVPSTLPSSSTAPHLLEVDLTSAPAAPAKAKYRHEFYQEPEEVVVTIFAKGIPKQSVNIDFADIITWAILEHGKGPAVLPKPNVSSEVSQRPAYPSSKKEKDEKLEGDAALNKFFREIYQSVDEEDTRRAMSKTFVSIISIFTLIYLKRRSPLR